MRVRSTYVEHILLSQAILKQRKMEQRTAKQLTSSCMRIDHYFTRLVKTLSKNKFLEKSLSF